MFEDVLSIYQCALIIIMILSNMYKNNKSGYSQRDEDI